jgi:hypothetical protein
MKTWPEAPMKAMSSEFLNHVRNGRAGSLSSWSKLLSEKAFGMSSAEFSVPDGLSEAEMRKTIGKSAQMRARTPRA